MMRPEYFGGKRRRTGHSHEAGRRPGLTALRRLTDRVLAGKTDAVVGKWHNRRVCDAEDREKLAVIEAVIETVDGRVPRHCRYREQLHTRHAVELSKEAEAGRGRALQVTPNYSKATQEGLVRHFYSSGGQRGYPHSSGLMFPSTHGVSIQPETYQNSFRPSQYQGDQGAGGDLSALAKTALLCGDGFDIYSGSDDQSVPVMALGGRGRDIEYGPISCRGDA